MNTNISLSKILIESAYWYLHSENKYLNSKNDIWIL
jgi:hypothetical protein